MSKRRLHLPEAFAGGEELLLQGDSFHYLAHVLRLEAGQQLELFDGRGRELAARVLALQRDGLRLGLGPSRPAAVSEAAAEVLLLAGMTRGASLDRVVRETTELGVAEIAPVITERSVAVPAAERRDARTQRWQRIAVQAARQCGRASVPPVRSVRPLPEALDELEAQAGRWSMRLVGQAGAQQGLSLTADAAAGGVAVLVGPEGGLAPEELALAERHGFRAVGLGPRTLRAETAAVVVVALVQHRLGQLG